MVGRRCWGQDRCGGWEVLRIHYGNDGKISLCHMRDSALSHSSGSGYMGHRTEVILLSNSANFLEHPRFLMQPIFHPMCCCRLPRRGPSLLSSCFTILLTSQSIPASSCSLSVLLQVVQAAKPAAKGAAKGAGAAGPSSAGQLVMHGACPSCHQKHRCGPEP